MNAARTDTAPARRSAASAPGHRTGPAATRLGPAAGSTGVLGLQRAAGNAATGAALRRGGILARCGAGGCSCGGTARDEDAERELAGGRTIARAVRARHGGT